MKKCTDCKYCVLIDYGYSNYTVEGTNVDCLKNEQGSFDRQWGEAKELKFANECTSFSEGDRTYFDVDRVLGEPENYSDDTEIKLLLKNNYTS